MAEISKKQYICEYYIPRSFPPLEVDLKVRDKDLVQRYAIPNLLWFEHCPFRSFLKVLAHLSLVSDFIAPHSLDTSLQDATL